MINVSEILCTGCFSCKSICPKDAIKIEIDERGFAYPSIDLKKCIDCNLCKKVCPCYSCHQNDFNKLEAYGAVHLDDSKLMNSQSGGAFAGLAEIILKNNGVAYGAAIGENLKVSQIRIDNLDELYKLQGSKYVQSDVKQTFEECADDLKNGKKVIYSGTSCMIDGLLHFLSLKKINTNRLITVDLICHGVASPGMYEENKKRIEEEYKDKIDSLIFRDKKYSGWHSHFETYILSKGNVIHENYWAELMYSHVMIRECCHDCKYIEIQKKVADITIADFWGVEKCNSSYIDDNKGCSLVIIHNDKAKKLLSMAPMNTFEVDVNQAVMGNMVKAPRKPQFYNAYWKDYKKNGFKHSLKKYTIYGGIVFKIKRKILKILRKWE